MTLWRTPRFWYDPETLRSRAISTALTPLSVLYDLGRRIARCAAPAPKRVPCPIICVGNLTAGGSGKTPTVLAIAEILRKSGLSRAPAFVTRGYGGTLSGPIEVNPSRHDARLVGDEALLLARQAQTIVARDRAAGAARAVRDRADVILLDDGFQTSSVHKDVNLLVIDGTMGLGNGRLIPAGPLREQAGEGFSRADAFVLIGPDRRNVRRLLPPGKPVFEASVKALRLPDPTCRWVAFAGLGRPEKFLETLESLGVRPVEWVPFPDHHPYSAKDIADLLAHAHAHKARLLTTEKDFLRLPPTFAGQVDTLPVALTFSDTESLIAFFKTHLPTRLDKP